MAIKVAAPIAMAMMLAGCGAIGAIGIPSLKRSDPPPLAPASLPPVETAALPPPGQVPQTDPFLPRTTVEGFGTGPANPPASVQQQPLPGATDPQQQALAAPQPSANIAPPAAGLGRTDLLGGWTITSGGDSCQLFMTLTSWQGGYRASTRGCSSDTLKAISAWDLKGNQVVLAGQGGSPLARLFSSGSGRFDGQTEGQGTAVSFYR